MNARKLADDSVDPAALLMGVLAVAVVPLVEPGEWGWINTGIAAVVGFALAAFYVRSWRWDALKRVERFAVIAVLWIVAIVLVAKPVQYAVDRD
ncbi:MAG: hypothetical protein LC808_15955, partial [Actinobacteria bacterium]|nr:hypothetical protein [Actinomycetota bacterium]